MDPFVAEVRIVPYNFPPAGWAFCDGQILPISQNTALFSLLGTTYGGNGQSTFALPNIQGRAVMHPDQGPGLSLRVLGETGGSETVTLLESEMPSHAHTARGVNDGGLQSSPKDALLARAGMYKNSPGTTTPMSQGITTPVGQSLPHNNMQPYLTMTYIIALQGVFPPRP